MCCWASFPFPNRETNRNGLESPLDTLLRELEEDVQNFSKIRDDARQTSKINGMEGFGV